MEGHGTKFIRGATPAKLEKPDPEGQIHVTYNQGGEEKVEQYDTVLFAIGRYAVTAGLNLEAAGVEAEKNGKFKANDVEQTNVGHIYAIGDVIYGQLELTPVAIKAGTLLSRRLFGGGTEKMDYVNVPTTVFTPLEYGCCGLDEEAAKEQFGAENISTFHSLFEPLEWQYNKERPAGTACYYKVLVNNADSGRVVGLHVLAPNAGEITQGLGVAMKCGMTKDQLDSCVGIHPTAAEDIIGLTKTKEKDGDNVAKGNC